MTLIETDVFCTLRARLTGSLVTRSDGYWDVARAAWVLNVDQRPSAVVHAETAQDVAETVAFAAANGLRVAPQGTGHNAAPLGDLAGTILLKTSRLRGISIDAGRRTARVEAGVLWQELTEAAAEHGLAGMIGSSPMSASSATRSAVGLSWFGRKHGLACTSLLAAEVVTADGVVRRVDADNDPGLFWALRGGGGSFAVVTALEIQLQPLPELQAGALFWPVERGEDVWLSWRDWVGTLPDDTTSWARFMSFPPIPEVPEPLRGHDFVIVEVCHLGTPEEAAALLEPMRRLAPVLDTVAPTPLVALSKLHMDPERPVPCAGEGMVLRDLPPEAVHALVRVPGAGSGSPLLSLEVRHLGGALARPADGPLGSFRGAFALYASA
jgi:FAD/FMN-containing dehydrogenase